MRRTISFLVPTIIFLLLLEGGCWALAKSGLLRMPLPSYSLKSDKSSLAKDQNFWADISPHWGVWHSPGSELSHSKSCLSVTYRANAHGMRDPERDIHSDTRRIAFLGDSMIEGFGVERDERLTSLLEKTSGLEVLYFGTAGDFGPTQYYLLYKHLVKQFAHDLVVIGMLPGNDFRDDDIDFGRRVYADRYRPYWDGEGPNYQLTYHRSTLQADTSTTANSSAQQKPSSVSENIKTFLRTYTYTYNALWYVKRVMIMKESMASSGYYDYTEAQLQKAQHSFKLIAEEAGDRPVILILLPLEQDLLMQTGSPEPSPLSKDLRKFAAENNILLLDLLPLMASRAKSTSDFYFECDGHWDAYGNQVANDLVYNFLKQQNLL